MQIIGIIAEYNPFHNGHLYHIKKIKELYPNSLIIAIISGEFTQRGHISILDKFSKASICLANQVDLVVKLPTFYSVQSADLFAYGAITILNYLKVDKIIIGSESNDLEKLKAIANVQINNKTFDNLLKEELNNKINYPTALSNSIKKLLGFTTTTPNDLLAVSYLKAIISNNYPIELESIRRTNDFHDNNSTNSIVSASNIRKKYSNNIDVSGYIPVNVHKYLNNDNSNMYFNLLKYKILTNINNLHTYLSVDEGIENKIVKNINKVNTLEDLILLVKNKRYTYNKLTRMFTHILLDIKKEDVSRLSSIKYIHILGFNSKGRSYLNLIKKDNILLTSNTNKLDNNLDRTAVSIYDTIFDYQNKLINKEIQGKPIIKG